MRRLILALLMASSCVAGVHAQNVSTPRTLDGFLGQSLSLGTGALTAGAVNGWSIKLILQDPQNWTTSIVTGGSGNAAGDVLTLNDSCPTHATVTAVAVTGGAVTQYTITGRGSCVTAPANPVGVLSTTGSGSGFTLTTTWGPPSLYGYVGNYGTNSPGTVGNYFASYVNPGLYGTENTILPGAGYAATGNSNFNTFAGDNDFGNGGGSPSVINLSTGYGNDCARDITSTYGISVIDCFGVGALKKLGSNTAYGSYPITTIAALSAGVFGNLTIPGNPGLLLGAGTNACAGNGASDVTLYDGVCLSPNGGQNLVNVGAFVILGDQAGNTWQNGTNVTLIGHSVDVPAVNTSNYLNVMNILKTTGTGTPLSSSSLIGGDLAAGGGTALTTSATTGFLHMTFTTGTPTGTPINGDLACVWNKATHVLDCNDGGTWYHLTATSGAG